MGLGFNDGFAPEDYSSPEPLVRITHEFWDSAELLKEALDVKQGSFVFGAEPDIVRAHPMNERTPNLVNFYKDFGDKYKGNWGEVSVSYMYVDAGESYPWHVDEEITKKTGNNPKGVLCAFNIVLLGETSEVEFKNLGSYTYKAALFNTSIMHRITPKTDRIIARIAFRDLSFEDVVQRIKGYTEIDPDKREWEYAGDGTKIYKLEAGKPTPTAYEK
jgi:hypothetical protein